MKKILLSMTLIFVLIMTVLPSTVYAKSEKPSRITISGSHYVAKGKKISLSANVLPAGANKKVTWKTSNKKIATITGKGVVAGKKSGKVKITVISKANKKVKKTFKITVKEKAATGVTISNAPEKMSIGQSVKLKAIIKPSKAAQSVRWSVSNKNAAVSSDGTVKALRKGTVNITAAATDGSNKKDFVTISVENPARKVEKTAIQAQEPRYVPIDEVGSFNSKIITPELMKSCTLPNLDKSALPYWTGVISENKISVNFHTEGWEEYTAGDTYWNEQELQYLADNGFNCIRVCYSLSYLSNPENVNLINVSELEQLDELISWCMKHNLHLIFSQTGLPGKWGSWGANWYPDYEYWNTQENVVNNTELYTSEKMQKTYKAYYDMLARRYKDIPNGVLSFELAVESTVPDNDMDLQTRVLGPVAETIWSYTPDRIVIVNDLQHTVPKKLAEMGCCISLHNHIYSINGRPIKDMFGVSYDPHWPMQYLPSMVLNDQTSPLIIQAEEKFSKGEFKIYAQYRNGWPVVLIDGKVVFEQGPGDPVYKPEVLTVTIPDGAKQIEVRFKEEMVMLGITIKQGSKETTIVSHGAFNDALYSLSPEKMPKLMYGKKITDISEKPVILDAAYFERTYLKPFIDTAKEYGVSFIMTEIGTDEAAALSPQGYLEYESCWLDALKKNNIGWMYNTAHNILAPEDLMWLNARNSKYRDFSSVPGMYGYKVNNTVMNFLKEYNH